MQHNDVSCRSVGVAMTPSSFCALPDADGSVRVLPLSDDYVATIVVDGVEGSILVRRFTSKRYSVPTSGNIGDGPLLRHVRARSPDQANDLWMKIAVTAIAAVRTHLGESHAAKFEISRHNG